MISSLDIATFVWDFLDKRMYCMISEDEAVVIDPHPSDDLLGCLEKSGVNRIAIYLTHEHIDHFIGVAELRKKYSCLVSSSQSSARNLLSDVRNGSYYFSSLFVDDPDLFNLSKSIAPQICVVDDIFEDEEVRMWKGNTFQFISTPGHTHGSTSILMNGEHIFTGDALLNGIPTITSMPGGSVQAHRNTILRYQSLDKDILVHPGHGEVGRLGEILTYNP